MTKKFVLEVLDRAVRTFAQTLVALWGVSGLDLIHVDWKSGITVALGATIMSVLTSVATRPVGVDKDSPSVVG